MTLAAGNTFTITYGDTGSGGPGATATSSTGAQTWQAQEKSTSAGSLTNLGASPSITVNAADGSGTLTTPTTNVSASQTGRTITFTYTAATGGISNGSVTLVVPSGLERTLDDRRQRRLHHRQLWHSLRSRARRSPSASLTLAARQHLHDHVRRHRQRRARRDRDLARAGAQTWQAQEKSTSVGSLTNLGSSPSITVNAADGSGTLTTGTTNVAASQTGRTITFTYTAATAGHQQRLGRRWSFPSRPGHAPSTTGANAGYSTSSAGTWPSSARRSPSRR